MTSYTQFVPEVDLFEETDEEAFGFLPLPSNKACKTRQIHKVSGELESLLEADLDED